MTLAGVGASRQSSSAARESLVSDRRDHFTGSHEPIAHTRSRLSPQQPGIGRGIALALSAADMMSSSTIKATVPRPRRSRAAARPRPARRDRAGRHQRARGRRAAWLARCSACSAVSMCWVNNARRDGRAAHRLLEATRGELRSAHRRQLRGTHFLTQQARVDGEPGPPPIARAPRRSS